MRIAFVGVKREYQKLDPEYRDLFTRFHLELPFYYARDGKNYVTVTTVDYEDGHGKEFDALAQGEPSAVLRHVLEKNFQADDYDVVVHWRKWFPEFWVPHAVNVINCQDHSFGQEWISSVRQAYEEKKLRGILCFPTWHKRNLQAETGLPDRALLPGVTLGVDTDVFKPADNKDPYQMLWASDLGRGVQGAIELAVKIFQKDKRFRLHICYPDNSPKMLHVKHPALVWHGQIPAGPELFKIFNETGILLYTSTFTEPSSRAHRQAQAAGSLVCYPPDRGSPSELIRETADRSVASFQGSVPTGLVSDPVFWPDFIVSAVNDGRWKQYGQAARKMAEVENWSTQALRFNMLFESLLREKNS